MPPSMSSTLETAEPEQNNREVEDDNIDEEARIFREQRMESLHLIELKYEFIFHCIFYRISYLFVRLYL